MQPSRLFSCSTLVCFYLLFQFLITGCQTVSNSHGSKGVITGEFQTPFDPSSPHESSTIPPAFVRLFDRLHRQEQSDSVESVLKHFASWKVANPEAFDPVDRHFVEVLAELVPQALKNPVGTLTELKSRRLQNRSQYLTTVILQSYLYQWTDNCERAIAVLTTLEPQTDGDAARWAERIWNILDGPCAYHSFLVEIENDVTLQGWWDLAKIAISSNTEHERNTRFRRWLSEYSQHVAARFPPALFRTQARNPKAIAVLLPQSGPLSSAADAIKNGLLSAHLTSPYHETTAIEVYDTSTTEVTTLIQHAIDDGVDVIVGPLAKHNVRRILEKRPVSVPIVSLNHPTPGGRLRRHKNLVQLAQVVEDDAKAVAQQLRRQNHHRILLVRGTDRWCSRAAESFRDSTDRTLVIAADTVLSDLSEATEVVANALGVTQSTSRQSEIVRTTLRRVEFTARRRHDIDAIVAFVDKQEFAALSAALHYHFAGEVPVFLAEPTFRDAEVVGNYANGTTFAATPAQLYSLPLTESIQESFEDASVLYPLYVFGIDAYRTAMQIDAVLEGNPVFGYTGYLRRDDQGMLSRVPVWGVVQGRVLQPRKQGSRNETRIPYLF